VTRPSKGAQIFPIVFGLIFMAFGLAFASGFLFGAPGRVHGNRWVGVLISAIFALIGGGVIYAGIYGSRKLKEQAAAEVSNPRSPWLWRKDWAASRAESKNRNSAFGLWAAAIFVNGIVFTIAASVVPQLLRTSDPKAFFPLAFCVVGVIQAGAAMRASIRRKRFGQTYFEFASLPFSPGRTLKGTIHLRFNTDARHGIDLSLSCVRQVITGGGKNRSSLQSVLWQADKNVPQASLAHGLMGDAVIPVEFSIPSDAYESNHDDPNDQVLWLLHAQADVPGVNYSDDFEVPVFRLTPSSASAAEPTPIFLSDAQGATAPPAFQSDPTDVAAPQNPKVVVSAGMDGSTEFYFPAFRNPSQVLVLIFFTVVWTAIVYFLAHSKAPLFFTVVFGLFELLLFYGLIHSTLVSFRIQAGNGRIVRRRALLGIGGAREFPFSDIAQILPVTNAQQPGTPASYSLRLQMRNGEKATLADMIDNRQEARWVAAQLEKLAGLKLTSLSTLFSAATVRRRNVDKRHQDRSHPFAAIVLPRSRWGSRSSSPGRVSSATVFSLGITASPPVYPRSRHRPNLSRTRWLTRRSQTLICNICKRSPNRLRQKNCSTGQSGTIPARSTCSSRILASGTISSAPRT